MSRWSVVSSVRWWARPALPVNSPTCRVCSSSRMRRQLRVGISFSAIRISSRASQHSRTLRPDAFFLAVVDRPKVEVGLHIPPAALDFRELLVAGGNVLGAQGRVRAAQQPLSLTTACPDRGKGPAGAPG